MQRHKRLGWLSRRDRSKHDPDKEQRSNQGDIRQRESGARHVTR